MKILSGVRFPRQGVGRLVTCFVLGIGPLAGVAAAQNWMSADGIPATSVYTVAEQNGVLYAVTDSAIYGSTDGGSLWSPILSQPPSTHLNSLHVSQGYLYAGSSGDGVFRTSNSGQSWDPFSSGLTGQALDITALAARGDSLYAATNGSGIYVMNLLNPVAWQPFNSGLFQFGAYSLISSDSMLVACIGSYVFVRPDGASQWTDAVMDSLRGRLPIAVYRHGQYLFLGTTGGVFRSDLTGMLWEQADIRAQASRPITTFASLGTRLFAGLNYRGEHWMWSTDSNGTNWDFRAHEFAYLYSLFPSHGRMWAGRTDGLWSIDVSGWTRIDELNAGVPATPFLYQNYPNPFNPSTIISFALPAKSYVSLKIFDVLGKEVRTIVSGELPAGRHSFKWNPQGQASGVYLCRLQSGSFSSSRKLILLR